MQVPLVVDGMRCWCLEIESRRPACEGLAEVKKICRIIAPLSVCLSVYCAAPMRPHHRVSLRCAVLCCAVVSPSRLRHRIALIPWLPDAIASSVVRGR